MDRGAWRAVVHGVAKSQTRLSVWAQLRDGVSRTLHPMIVWLESIHLYFWNMIQGQGSFHMSLIWPNIQGCFCCCCFKNFFFWTIFKTFFEFVTTQYCVVTNSKKVLKMVQKKKFLKQQQQKHPCIFGHISDMWKEPWPWIMFQK